MSKAIVVMQDFQLDKQAINRGFSRAAKTYDEASILPQEINRRSMERLSYIKFDPALVVDIGSGTGFAIPLLQQRFQKADIVALDCVFDILAHNTSPELKLCADAEHLPMAPNSVDMIFANFTLPYLNDLPRVFKEWSRVLKPDGLLMFTTLGPDSLIELRSSWAQVDNHLRTHAFYDLHDIGDMLLKAGFKDPVLDVERITLTYKTMDHLCRDLKAQGAMNVLKERYRGLTTQSQIQRVKEAYEVFREDGVLPATFEVTYAHAWGADLVSGVDAGGEVRIPISHLKRG